jgi:hypothetical protein
MDLEPEVVRVVRSRAALDKLITAIEDGRQPRPDWIHLQSEARLDRIDIEDWPPLLVRLHRSTRRGFRTARLPICDPDELLEGWRCIARHGFHDFGDDGWTHCHDSPFIEDYDYLAAYLERGLDALDAYAIYSAVLGSHDYGVEDFLRTERCRDLRTLIEPMAGTAEFAYQGHFQFPDFRYLMIDLDSEARDRVLERPWLEDTEHHYFVADVLDEEVWKQAKAMSSGPALAFVGKQSHQLFDTRELCRLLELGTLYADSLVLETPAMALVSEMDSEEELTRPEMEAAGLHVGLVDEPGTLPHPFTNRISFRLEAWDETGRRSLFRYPRWTVWSQPTLVSLAELHGLHASYFHSELDEFVPVEHDASGSDCHDNVTFMLFSRDAR